MEFLNSTFRDSTIREDSGIKGAIFVDSILIRESELPYSNGYNLIPLSSIKDETFLNNLKGLLVFKEHPRDMINVDNYEHFAKESVGSIVNAEYKNIEGDNVVYGTLRITNPRIIDDLKNKKINGGSLGYYAKTIDLNGKPTQIDLKPNHFSITQSPRDKEVIIFNSEDSTLNKGVKMTEKEMAELIDAQVTKRIKAELEMQNSVIKNSNTIEIPLAKFNGFMQTIGSRIADNDVRAIFNSKEGLDKLDFIDNALAVRDIFNLDSEDKKDNEDDSEDKKEKKVEAEVSLEELKKENSLLKEQLEKIKNSIEESKEKDKENSEEEDDKENSDGEEDKENGCSAKKNALFPSKEKEIKNSNEVNNYSLIASQIVF